jgi:hypothetical protein
MSDYTKEMVAAITAAAPLDAAKAQQIAETDDFVRASKTKRSVIAKAKSLGLEYIKAAPRAKAVQGPTKADRLQAIRTSLALPDRLGDFTKAELEVIWENIG